MCGCGSGRVRTYQKPQVATVQTKTADNLGVVREPVILKDNDPLPTPKVVKVKTVNRKTRNYRQVLKNYT